MSKMASTASVSTLPTHTTSYMVFCSDEEIIADNIIQMLNISNLAIRSFSIPSSSIGDDSSIVFED